MVSSPGSAVPIIGFREFSKELHSISATPGSHYVFLDNHRDLKPHNILLAANDRKGPGLGRKSGSAIPNGVGRGDGEEEGGLEVPRKLSGMRDVSNFVLKISDMGLGKQLLNGQSRCAGPPTKQWRRPFCCRGGSLLLSSRIKGFFSIVAGGVGQRRFPSARCTNGGHKTALPRGGRGWMRQTQPSCVQYQ